MRLKLLHPKKKSFWVENVRMIFVLTLGIKRGQELKEILVVIVGELRAEH